jgi:hypothetical protein
MFEMFLNPWTMVAGAALVSAPIIIHLINRMRFRRVKWAAMEFLLKAQKRMRRKLIIEQLILLLLRCLLVFLVGLLLARFLGFSPLQGKETRPTMHVVVLDDTPSMADAARGEEGRPTTAFDQAKAQIAEKIAPAAAEATTPQTLTLLRLSDLASPRDFERLNAESIRDLGGYLAQFRPTPVRVSLADGLRKAREILDAKSDKDTAKVLHVVSDMRAVDWATDGEAVKGLVKEMTDAGVKVHLLDVAHPYRRDDRKTPPSGENVGVVEFAPKARVVARNHPVDFTLRVKNFGAAEANDLRLEVHVNGVNDPRFGAPVPNLPPNQERAVLIPIQFDRVGTEQNPLDRFNLVTAVLRAANQDALAADDARHAVVECRDRLAVLVVEGRPGLRDDKAGDSFYLRRLFVDAFGGINWVNGSVNDLEKQDLRHYAAVYLLNVPSVTEAAAKNLEGYVRNGGGLGVFLGPDVRPAEYNKLLYAGGNGVFPVPLPDSPTPPLTEKQQQDRALVFNKRILLRDPSARTHPALQGLYTNERGAAVRDVEIERFFYFLNINRHWPVQRIGRWLQDRSVQELYCLPNEQSVANFEGAVSALVTEVRRRIAEPKYEKYRPYLDGAKAGDKSLLETIRTTAATDNPLSLLAIYLDRLLCDQINDGDESEPVLREFWTLPEMADLRAEAARVRDSVKFGDPLYLVKQFGTGRVAVMTTTAGEEWTDWPTQKGSPAWLAVVAEMQRYLSGGGVDANRAVGSAYAVPLDPARYGQTYTRTFVSFDPARAKPGQEGSGLVIEPAPNTPSTDLPLDARENELALRYADTQRPGAYLFTLTRLKGPDDPAITPAERPDYLAIAFNLDEREGDLRRVMKDDVTQQAPGAALHSPEDTGWMDELKQKQSDLSSNRWIYLIILLVLIAEQAMAVRLSFHTRPEDLELHAPTAASAFHRGAPPAPSTAAESEPEPANV